MPVDLFPMTPHCELIVELERVGDVSAIQLLPNAITVDEFKIKSTVINNETDVKENISTVNNGIGISMALNKLSNGEVTEKNKCSDQIIHTVV